MALIFSAYLDAQFWVGVNVFVGRRCALIRYAPSSVAHESELLFRARAITLPYQLVLGRTGLNWLGRTGLNWFLARGRGVLAGLTALGIVLVLVLFIWHS